MSVDDVLSCPSFDDARRRYAEVIACALRGGPPEAVFQEHWAPAAQFHASLRSVIAKAVAATPPPAAAPSKPAPPTVEEILGCRDFDDARGRYPRVIERALKGGPPEEVFRAQWAPDAEFHASLRNFVTCSLAAIAAEGPAAAAAPARPALPSVELKRNSDGEFWGFLPNKSMKVIQVNPGGPADRAGLRKGQYVVQVETSAGMLLCETPGDAYGPRDSAGRYCHHDQKLILTVAQSEEEAKQFRADAGAPEPEEQKAAEKRDRPKEEDQHYAEVGFEIAKRSKEDGGEQLKIGVVGGGRPDTVLQYIQRQKEAALARSGSAYLGSSGPRPEALQRAAERAMREKGGVGAQR